MRVTEKSYNLGMATAERYNWMAEKREKIQKLLDFTDRFSIKPALINDSLERLGTAPLRQGCKLSELIGRPQITVSNISECVLPFKNELNKIEYRKEEIIEALEILIKYKGYIEREQMVADKMLRLENIKIQGVFDYDKLTQITIEARQKLKKINPTTLAQASRIPGVSPSDINVMLILLGR